MRSQAETSPDPVEVPEALDLKKKIHLQQNGYSTTGSPGFDVFKSIQTVLPQSDDVDTVLLFFYTLVPVAEKSLKLSNARNFRLQMYSIIFKVGLKRIVANTASELFTRLMLPSLIDSIFLVIWFLNPQTCKIIWTFRTSSFSISIFNIIIKLMQLMLNVKVI
jgi:hypothetical protein